MRRLLALALVFLVAANPAYATFSARQNRGTGVIPIGAPVALGSHASSAATDVITTGATAAVGSLIVVSAGETGGVIPMTAVDSAGNTYTPLTGESNGVSSGVDLLYTIVTTQLSSGGTITVTSTGATAMSARAASVSGIISSPSDTGARAAGSGTAVSVTSPTWGKANEIVFAVTGTNNAGATVTEDAAFTNLGLVVSGQASSNFAYKIIASTTALTYAPTLSSIQVWSVLIWGFKGN